ncbi:hypothetical protein B1207_02005 [Legionella quinlivanii]|uniref:Hemolysin D n=1 Tax=Legionella quinlivanii TaxID=45073 RepID=A0A364LNQ0_9GAMM|nr:efflux RND transporter periplasmic adaptor subunit [Legionella quinlivanii]RAP38676.1 hypothetical protein B1207_02005 [Legionella quinlivanii]
MKSRFSLLLLAILAVISFFYVKFAVSGKQHSQPQPPLITVETAHVTERVLAEQFETLGSLASMDSIDISSEIAGQISAIHFQPGALVKKDTLLIQLDSTVMKSQLASAKASLSLSETNYKRTKELAQKSLASEQALDRALADLREKRNAVKVKQAQLEKLNLRAPFTGTLGSKQVSVGQYVKMGQALVHLVANQQLRVEYNVPERLLPRLHNGQRVRISSDAFPTQVFIGKVNYIAPAIDKDTRTIAVEALIDNSKNQLSAGLFVRVKHQLGLARKRLLVPEESLIPTISGQKIFVLRGDKAITVRVKTGTHHAAMTEVCQGLKADDIIIVRGQHKLKEGTKVIAVNHIRSPR